MKKQQVKKSTTFRLKHDLIEDFYSFIDKSNKETNSNMTKVHLLEKIIERSLVEAKSLGMNANEYNAYILNSIEESK